MPFIFRETLSMQKFLPFIAILAFASCTIARPLSKEPSQNNVTYTVEYLFEHDGCKVYRFYDRGNYVYFTNCKGEAIAMTDSTAIRNTTRLVSKYFQPGPHREDIKKQQ